MERSRPRVRRAIFSRTELEPISTAAKVGMRQGRQFTCQRSRGHQVVEGWDGPSFGGEVGLGGRGLIWAKAVKRLSAQLRQQGPCWREVSPLHWMSYSRTAGFAKHSSH